jgi:uncharacterized protein (DUF1501 family)
MINRRHFLQLTAAAALAPTILGSRRARATNTAAFGAMRHVLVLHAQGGFRSHCTFNALGKPQHNPFGTQASAPGTEWVLGAACGNVAYSTSLGNVPAFADVTNDVCVLACVDQNPGGAVEVDHVKGHRRAATGREDGDTGILSLVGAHHPLYKNGFSASVLPPVEIVPTDMGLGAGEYGERRPLTLLGAAQSAGAGLTVKDGFHTDVRAALDENFLAHRNRAFSKRLRNFHTSKQNAALFAHMLLDPTLDVVGHPEASDAGVTNAQLIEVLGNADLSTIGDPTQGITSWGSDVALALRCFANGSPMVAVTRNIYDMHSIEHEAYPARTQDLVRQLAGLNFLLKRMPHPDGGTYFDKTLVVTLSEFSRNNTDATTGFNSGDGSDHVQTDDAPCRNQAIAVMGGAVSSSKRGKLIGHTNSDMVAQDGVVDIRSLLSTLLDVQGIDGASLMGAQPIAELFT